MNSCVLTGNTCYCWRLEYWKRLGERSLEEKIIGISWSLLKRKGRQHSKYSATELSVRMRDWIWEKKKRGVFVVSLLLDLTRQNGLLTWGVWWGWKQSRNNDLDEGDHKGKICVIQSRWEQLVMEDCHSYTATEQGKKLQYWIWGNRGRKGIYRNSFPWIFISGFI